MSCWRFPAFCWHWRLSASLEKPVQRDHCRQYFSIPTFARVVRGSTLAVRKLEYIDAMRSLGASDGRIIFGHILPNITSPIIVQATLRIAVAILTASGLSFLGLGAQPPTPEWGAMLNDGRNYIMDHPHVALFPGLSIVFVVIAFNLLGDGLRDVLDPKMKNNERSCRAMLIYSIRRLIQTIPVVIGVTIVVFLLMHLIPGDAAQVIIGEGAPKEQVEKIRENLGLNDPLPLQYWNYVSGLLQGIWGFDPQQPSHRR